MIPLLLSFLPAEWNTDHGDITHGVRTVVQRVDKQDKRFTVNTEVIPCRWTILAQFRETMRRINTW
jgi:hypothetical protein